jgi:histidinol-phosphatase (PHP family)
VIVDYHIHLRDERGNVAHVADSVGPFVETALARGVDEIGFTEHVYYFRETVEIWDIPYLSERCVYDLDAYCDAVVEAKSAGLPVKLGLEIDYVGERQERLSELLDGYPWDFRLGSVHWLDGLAVDMVPGAWGMLSVDEVWRRYVSAFCEFAAGGSVEVMAHPDLVKIFGRRPEGSLLAELHEQAAAAMAAAGVAAEISTGGLRKPVGELYPDAAFLEACVRAGVPITLASDAHEPDLVGADFPQALALARSAGCETVTVFEGRVGRQLPLG